jgi:hypothetical protein
LPPAAAALDFDPVVRKIGAAEIPTDATLVREACGVSFSRRQLRRCATEWNSRVHIATCLKDHKKSLPPLNNKSAIAETCRTRRLARSHVRRNKFCATCDRFVEGFANAVQLDLPKLTVELQAKYAELERLAGGAL